MKDTSVIGIEAQRLMVQEQLDARKHAAERNRLGQFATPTGLALDIQRYAKAQLGICEDVRFIDPAIGTGAFYSALLNVFPQTQISTAVGYEIDEYYGRPATKLWSGTGLDVRLEDFTKAKTPASPEKFNLLICNPPYVRHHHIINAEKHRLNLRAQNDCGVKLTGLSGLYCYFLILSHAWMADDGLAGWLIPSEFMDVNYGVSVKQYLLDKVTLVHIHRFDPSDVQFTDALVSSSVIWLRNKPCQTGHRVRFTFGGPLEQPKHERFVPVEVLRHDPKWTRYPLKNNHQATEGPRLGDFFNIKRGLVTGNNKYFILPDEMIKQRGLPMEAFKPILPSPRYVPTNEVNGDHNGYPILEHRLFLLDPPWTEIEIKERFPNLWMYLEEGKSEGVPDRYLCRHRTLWYTQELRPPAPFVCTYLGRSNTQNDTPFRFILNNSNATAANVYLMLYPKDRVKRILQDRTELKWQVWEFLNQICPQAMLGEGRVYGRWAAQVRAQRAGKCPGGSVNQTFTQLIAIATGAARKSVHRHEFAMKFDPERSSPAESHRTFRP